MEDRRWRGWHRLHRRGVGAVRPHGRAGQHRNAAGWARRGNGSRRDHTRRRCPPLRQPRHLSQQLAHRLRTLLRKLRQHSLKQLVELVGQVGVDLDHRRNLRIHRRVRDLHPVGPDVGQPAGQHLERQDSHRVDVGALVDVMTHHLLRRHVARGSDGKADRREVGRLARASSKPKVREHCPAVCVDQHVGRLEVAVHDAGVVRVLQPVTDLTQVAPGGERVERTSVEDVAQRAAADQRHRDRSGGCWDGRAWPASSPRSRSA